MNNLCAKDMPMGLIGGLSYQILNKELWDNGKPILVSTHGNSVGLSWIMPAVKARAKKREYCEVIFSLPGHDESIDFIDHQINTIMESIKVLFDYLKLDELKAGYVLNGWSYSGNLFTEYLRRYGEGNCQELILAASPFVNLGGYDLPEEGRSDTFAKDVVNNNYHLVKDLSDDEISLFHQAVYFPSEAKKTSNIPHKLAEGYVDPGVRGDIMPSLLAGQIGDPIEFLQNREQIKVSVVIAGLDALINPENLSAGGKLIKADEIIELEGPHAVAYVNAEGLNKVISKAMNL